ncbi:sarcosine oxidase [Friedmanniella luteola]|uniref:Sarcosine oxidase n=1 Tax=Friedmanniella luteola TaxID=546871 RepID=A0A1H1SII5_9ACTN|nr:N-methyl-L-tryptophan oxidase [Friedmanniella luteola]SDS47785.1 sarcosine oxidase [Friedmanniella luteola]
MEHDVIVVGVGGMGAAAADALAGRGQRVLALEQFGLAHARGSSHGSTRIVRQAYFESPDYLPLLRRAYQLWDALPPALALHRVGCLVLGHADSPVLTGAAATAARCGVAVQTLTAAEVRRRFPAFRPGDDEAALLEPDAGFVRPELTVAHLAGRARQRGARVLTDQRVLAWEVTGDGVAVRTRDAVHRAARLVLAAGAWTPALAGSLGIPIRVERRVMHFFTPSEPGRFAPARMPTFIWDLAAGDSLYGFPLDGADGVKVGFHNRGPVIDPDRLQPDGSAEEVDEMRAVLDRHLPGAAGRLVRSTGCLYASTPDEDFVLGLVPGLDDRVVVAAGFSGHGFKFVPVVGEVVADLVVEGTTPFDLGFLAPTRFAATADP